ncbi:MAG: hypothetical protein ABSH06_21075 [Thermodesulfobacteriota bacterium]
MRGIKTYDNSDRLLYDMDCCGVDMAIIMPASKETQDKAMRGEIEWTIQEPASEIDRLLSTGKFVGIGEGIPTNPTAYTKKSGFARTSARSKSVPFYM